MLFKFLEELIATQDGLILFILMLIAVAMVIDVITGMWSARFNKDLTPSSNIGINGILRKIASIMLMVFFIPVSVLIPGDTGVALIYTLYIGYLSMEILSIVENMEKMGIKTAGFIKVVDALRGKKEDKNEEL